MDTFENHKTRCVNVLHILNYFFSLGASEEELLEGINVDRELIYDPDKWLNIRNWYILLANCQKFSPFLVLDDWQNIGFKIKDSKYSDLFKSITRFVGVKPLYRMSPKYNSRFNTYSQLELNELKSGYADILIRVDTKVNSSGMGLVVRYNAGVLSAVPTALNYEPGNATIVFDQALLKNIVTKVFFKYELDYKSDGINVFIGNKPIGRHIQLLNENNSNILSDKYSYDRPYNAILILSDLICGNYRLLKKGSIFDAPYGRIKVNWNDTSFFQRLWHSSIFNKKNKEKVIEHFNYQLELAEHRFFESEKLRQKEELTNIELKRTLNELNIARNTIEKYANSLEDKVQEKTLELKKAQEKLLEAEKRSLEHRITGGFAHEMRNALAGAQLEFRSIRNYKQQGLPATDAIKTSTTRLFENLEQLQKKYQIPMDEIASSFIPEIKDIASVLGDLSQTMSGVHKDLERGLSITNQIREYAKMSEFKPGNQSLDLMEILRGYRDKFGAELSAKGISLEIEGPDNALISGDETHMNSIFSNLIKNAGEALTEKDSDDRSVQVRVVETDNEEGKEFTIKIKDNGPGISKDHLQEIFEPFFSTKPTTGTGLGLGIVKRLVQLYGGEISVDSVVGEGTTFTVTLPEINHGRSTG